MAKEVLNPVSDAHVVAFDGFMRKWQRLLNLMDWRVVRSSKRTIPNMAEISKRSLPDRLASYKVGIGFGSTPVTPHSLEEIACHEMLHVLLCELVVLARDDNSTDDILMAAEHRVINTIVPLLVPEPKEAA